MLPGGASIYHRRYHASVTNYADATGQQSPDLLQRTHHGLAWTPIDGLYNLCHVVPRGPLASATYHSSASGPGADRTGRALNDSTSCRRSGARSGVYHQQAKNLMRALHEPHCYSSHTSCRTSTRRRTERQVRAPEHSTVPSRFGIYEVATEPSA
jgi:hypothetical protein